MIPQVADTETCLVASFVEFLKTKKTSSNEETVEIVIQCLSDLWPSISLNTKTVNLQKLLSSDKESVTVNKEQAEEWKKKGNDALSSKEYEESVKCYTKAIDFDPTCCIYPCNRAAAYSLMGKDELAVDDCLYSIKLDSKYCKAWKRLGLAYFNLQKYSDSVDAYMHAKELDPNDQSIEQGLKAAQEKLSKTNTSGSSSPSNIPDISQMLRDPNMMDMAKNLMNSGALNDLLKNPAIAQMASSMFGKGGANPRQG